MAASWQPRGDGVGGRFGERIAVSGDTMMIGASDDDEILQNAGAVILYQRAPGPVRIFTAGFESGDTAAWATTP